MLLVFVLQNTQRVVDRGRGGNGRVRGRHTRSYAVVIRLLSLPDCLTLFALLAVPPCCLQLAASAWPSLKLHKLNLNLWVNCTQETHYFWVLPFKFVAFHSSKEGARGSKRGRNWNGQRQSKLGVQQSATSTLCHILRLAIFVCDPLGRALRLLSLSLPLALSLTRPAFLFCHSAAHPTHI